MRLAILILSVAMPKHREQEKNRIDNIDMLYTSIQSLINRAEEDEDRTIDTIIRKLVLLDMLEQQQRKRIPIKLT